MNLVGKIFVVLIFVLSLVLMTLTMMVYVTHTNWRLRVDNPKPRAGEEVGLIQQVGSLTQENEGLRAQYTLVYDEIEKLQETKRRELAKLETERDRQMVELAALQEELDTLKAAQQQNVKVADAALLQVTELVKDSDRFRTQIQSMLDELDRERKQHEILVGRVNESQRRVKELQTRSEALTAELVGAKAVLSYLNIPPDLAYVQSAMPPAGLIARVVEVNNDRKLVEISVGSDDGSQMGHQWEVQDATGGKYIGRIQVIDVSAHRSTCSVMAGFENGVIAKGQRAVPVKVDMGRLRDIGR